LPNEMMAFTVALIAAVSLTFPVRRLALYWGMVDLPGPRKVHATPVPLLGGVAIYLAFLLALVVTTHGPTWTQIFGILGGATLVAVVGFLDDSGLLHHQLKLFVAMPLAGLLLLASGIRAQVFVELIPGPRGAFLDGCLTILWVVGITAAFSILDHMDGLCAGIAAIAAASFALFAFISGQVLVSTLAAATFGAALGFLGWNFKPAKIFMGDGGAMLLGFLMDALGLKLRLPSVQSSAQWLVPVLVLGVPIFDTTLISISRSRRGLLPFTSPGKDHTAHRLANLGLGQKHAVLTLYALGVLFGESAFLLRSFSSPKGYALAGSIALLGFIAILRLEKAPYEHQQILNKRAT